MDEYEKLRVRTGKAQYDSVDLLAYHKEKNTLLLVNCTIAVPDPNMEVPRLDVVRKRLVEELFKDTNLQVFLVLFSPHRDLELPKDVIKNYRKKMGVNIIDGNDVEQIVSSVRDGKLDEAFEILRP